MPSRAAITASVSSRPTRRRRSRWGGDIAPNDTFEIRSLTLGAGARQPAVVLWHQEANDVAPGSEKVSFRIGESQTNTGAAIMFSRFGGPALGTPGPLARKLIEVRPLGDKGGGGESDGVYDVVFLEDSSMYRDAIFNMPNRKNALRWHRDARHWEFSAGMRCETRRISEAGACADTDYIVLCDMSRGAYAFSLPSAGAAPNRVLVIKKDDASGNVLTITSAGGTIDGASTLLLAQPWSSARFVSHGGSWHRIA
jgi:hypothetical protein